MFRSSYKSSGTVISLPEQLVSAPEQLGYADFLHTMTPIRFHIIQSSESLLFKTSTCSVQGALFKGNLCEALCCEIHWINQGRHCMFYRSNVISHKHGCCFSIQWRRIDQSAVSNHQQLDSLSNYLLTSKETSKPASMALCQVIRQRPMDSPYQGPMTQKALPWSDVSMYCLDMVRYRKIRPCTPGVIQWLWCNHTIPRVPMKQSWKCG